MVLERKICEKKTSGIRRFLEKTESIALGIMGILGILILLSPFLLFAYNKYSFMSDCLQDGSSEEKCIEIWEELVNID